MGRCNLRSQPRLKREFRLATATRAPEVPRAVALLAAAAFSLWASVGLAQARPDTVPRAQSSLAALTLRPGDLVGIRIWPDSSLSGEYPIEESGNVYLPMLGPVRAAGVPLDELRDELRRRYSQSMRTPVVSITPRFRVGVLGAVQRPGLYHVSPTLTLYDVIALAGGFRVDARQERIRVVREQQVFEVNARRALELGEALSSLELRSGDQIVVPDRRPFPVLQVASLGIQALVLVVTVLNYSTR
jgi:polysaccharide export outer membrane protein